MSEDLERAAPDVRTRILEAAWALIGERQDAGVSLLDIARAAGVSRQTVYVNFGSRAGLLLAMVDHRDATSRELKELRRAREERPGGEVLEAVVQAWFRYLPVVFTVSRALAAAAALDPDARTAWESRMAKLRTGLLALTRRLAEEGRLAPGWTPEAAADWCHHLMHVDTWQHLVVERQWRPADAVRTTVASLTATLLREPATTAQSGSRPRRVSRPPPR